MKSIPEIAISMKALLAKVWKLWYVKIALLALAFVFPFVTTNSYLTYICVMIMIYSIAIFGYNFMTGFAGTFIMSQAAFCGLGGYMSAYISMNCGIPVMLSMFLGACFAALCGFLLSLPTQRLQSTFLSLATLGFNQLMYIVYQNATPFTGGAYGIKDIPRPTLFGVRMDNTAYYIMTLIVLIICYILLKNVLASKTGRVMFAIAVDPSLAASMGINPGKYRSLIFTVCSFFGGLAGALQVHFINYTFAKNYTGDETMMMLSMMALGGMSSLSGSIVGPAIFLFISLYFASLYNYRLFICGAMLILTMLFRPNGIMGGKLIAPRKSSLRYISTQDLAREANVNMRLMR